MGSQLAGVLALLDERASMSARPFWRSCMAKPTKRLTLDALSTTLSALPFNWAHFPANPCTLGSLWIRATTCHRSIHLALLTHRPTSLSSFSVLGVLLPPVRFSFPRSEKFGIALWPSNTQSLMPNCPNYAPSLVPSCNLY